MVDVAEELSPDDVKAAALYLRDLYKEQSTILVKEAGEISRWLSASLLAVNTGALFAFATNWDKFLSPILPGGLLLVGIAAAMLSGVFNQFAYLRAIPIVMGLMGHATRVGASGVFDQDAREALAGAEGKLKGSFRWVGPAAGWLSGILFIAGAVQVGISVDHHQLVKTRPIAVRASIAPHPSPVPSEAPTQAR